MRRELNVLLGAVTAGDPEQGDGEDDQASEHPMSLQAPRMIAQGRCRTYRLCTMNPLTASMKACGSSLRIEWLLSSKIRSSARGMRRAVSPGNFPGHKTLGRPRGNHAGRAMPA